MTEQNNFSVADASISDSRPMTSPEQNSFDLNRAAVIVAACVVAFALRLVQLPIANFGCLLALSLFCGSLTRHRAAVLIPLAVRVLSDLTIHYKTGYGFFPSWPFDYGAYVLVFALGTWIRPNQATRIACGSVTSVALYFVLSNLGCWWIWPETYEHSVTGLLACYENAIPFVRGTLWGNLLMTAVFFSAWRLVSGTQPAVRPEPSGVR
ncbi:MAG: DUF6580 family putative transport protein [Planctomycetaceae bacterium]